MMVSALIKAVIDFLCFVFLTLPCFLPDSPLELIQLPPVVSSIVLIFTELLLPLLSLSGSLLLQPVNLHMQLVQLPLPAKY